MIACHQFGMPLVGDRELGFVKHVAFMVFLLLPRTFFPFSILFHRISWGAHSRDGSSLLSRVGLFFPDSFFSSDTDMFF